MKNTRTPVKKGMESSYDEIPQHEEVRDGLWFTNHLSIRQEKETIDYHPREKEVAPQVTLESKSAHNKDYHTANKEAFTRRPSQTPVKVPFEAVSSRRVSKRAKKNKHADDKDEDDMFGDTKDWEIQALNEKRKKRPQEGRKEDEEEMQDRPKITPYKIKKERDTLYRTERSKEGGINQGKSSYATREERELQECTFRPQTNENRLGYKAQTKNTPGPSSKYESKPKSRKHSGLDMEPEKIDKEPNEKSYKTQTKDPTIEAFNTADENDPGEVVVGRNADGLLKWGREKDSKLAAKRVKAASSIEKECTFNPKLNPRSAKIPLKDYVPPEARYHTKFKRQKSKHLNDMEAEHQFRPKINEKSVEILRKRQADREAHEQQLRKEEADRKYLEDNLQNKSFYSRDSNDSNLSVDSRSKSQTYHLGNLKRVQALGTVSPTKKREDRSPSKNYTANNSPKKAPRSKSKGFQVWKSPPKAKKEKYAANGMPILNTSVAKPRLKEKREQASQTRASERRSRSRQSPSRSKSRTSDRRRHPHDEEEIKRRFRNVGEKFNTSHERRNTTSRGYTVDKSMSATKKPDTYKQTQGQHKKICEQPAALQDMPLKRKEVKQDVWAADKENRTSTLNKTWTESGLPIQQLKKIRKVMYPDMLA